MVYIIAIVYSLRNLCDTDNSGKLNSEQFALAMYLLAESVQGREPPTKLPQHLIPPTKRRPSTKCTSLTTAVLCLLLMISISVTCFYYCTFLCLYAVSVFYYSDSGSTAYGCLSFCPPRISRHSLKTKR